MGRLEQSFLVMLPRFLQPPQRAGPTPPPVPAQPGLAATCAHVHLGLYLVYLQLGISGRKGRNVCK